MSRLSFSRHPHGFGSSRERLEPPRAFSWHRLVPPEGSTVTLREWSRFPGQAGTPVQVLRYRGFGQCQVKTLVPLGGRGTGTVFNIETRFLAWTQPDVATCASKGLGRNEEAEGVESGTPGACDAVAGLESGKEGVLA